MNYLVAAFYKFVDPAFTAESLDPTRTLLKTQMLMLGIRGTILLAEEGMNGTVVGEEPQMREFMAYLNSLPGLETMAFKESLVDHIPFKRTLVKLKTALIPFGRDAQIDINPAKKTGKHISPKELKAWLDQGDPNLVLVDTRNNYEIKKGTFKGALDWNLRHFRDFPEVMNQHKKELIGKKVVMFCTGGIRCEKATAYAGDQGLDVYQIDGGILKYFEDVGGDHYEGDCFVFDYRVAVNPKLEPVKYDTAFPDGREIDDLDGHDSF
jgi:UPF0176 protein